MSDKTIDVADKVVDKIADGVSAITAAFERTAPHAWEVIVRQQVIEGYVWAVTLGLSWVIVTILGILSVRRLDKLPVERLSTPHPAEAYFGIVLVFTIVLVILSLRTMPETLTQIINPEYHAAIEIMSHIGGK